MPVQLDATLAERDWRWNCHRSFEVNAWAKGWRSCSSLTRTLPCKKYYDRPWANFTGTCPPSIAFHAAPFQPSACQRRPTSCQLQISPSPAHAPLGLCISPSMTPQVCGCPSKLSAHIKQR